jgi:hypothetical protein
MAGGANLVSLMIFKTTAFGGGVPKPVSHRDASFPICAIVPHPCPISDWAAPEPPPRGGRFASCPSVRARRSLFRSPHTSPAKCLRIPRSRLRTVHRTVQSGFAGPSLTPHTGRVSGCKASALPTERRLAFAESALCFPPLGSGAVVPV